MCLSEPVNGQLNVFVFNRLFGFQRGSYRKVHSGISNWYVEQSWEGMGEAAACSKGCSGSMEKSRCHQADFLSLSSPASQPEGLG